MKYTGSFFLIVFVIIVIIIITSCKYQDNNTTNNISTDNLFKKTIVFPNSLLKLNGTQFQKIDSFISEIEDRTKIISIIDGSCIKCIVYQLNRIDSIFSNICPPVGDNILIFILNVHREDSVYFMRYLQPYIKVTGVILWDNNYNFERQNKLFTSNMNLRTFMINNENMIIQFGNPVMHPDLISEYQEKLLCKYLPDSLK